MKSIFKKVITSILILESRLILKKYKPKIIAITGSVGKTSTKDAIFSVLSTSFHIRKSQKSYNSEIGLPLTILGCDNGWNDPFAWIRNILEGLDLIFFKSDYPKYLVLEIGADHPGDIKSISKWLQTDVVVITRIGDVPVHVEFFPSPEALVKEKSYLIKTLKNTGLLVLSADDDRVRVMSDGVSQKCLTYGISSVATVTATDIEILYDENKLPEGLSFKLNFQGNSVSIKIKGVLGNQHIYALLPAVAIASSYGIFVSKIISALENHVFPKGRMNIVKGMKGSLIIDDTYNSSPEALKEGLSLLSSLQVSGKRIAVLGDMLELGKFSLDEHRKAGIQALQSSDILVTVGQRARLMSDRAISLNTSDEALEYLQSIVAEGDIVFVKGSQGMRMERVTKGLMNDPSKSGELLVRQEKEWLAKK